MSVEEARFISAHVSVALRVAIDNLLLSHLSADIRGLLRIDKVWHTPVAFGNDTIFYSPGAHGSRDSLELVVEWLIVQEHPGVVVIPVESVLDVPYRFNDFMKIRISGKSDKPAYELASSKTIERVILRSIGQGVANRRRR